jgi:DNA-binding HxlR family transcriptional regulator
VSSFRGNHHYVSQSYLKAWGDRHKRVWTYHTLVSHENVPVWSQAAIKSIVSRLHLFTRSVAGVDADEFEIWMEREIETPAQDVLDKIRSSNTSLIADEWDRLLRYVALHDVRNPARYDDNMNRWRREVPDILEDVLNSSVKKLEEAMINDHIIFKSFKIQNYYPSKYPVAPLQFMTKVF